MKYKYDIFNRHEYHTHLLAYDLINESSRVLDIGCATGYFAKELKKKNCETWGIDNDVTAVKKAKKYCHRAEQEDLNLIKKFSLPKKYFDFVLLMDVIEHLNKPERILKSVKSHLKKDGRLIISVPNIAHASSRLSILVGKFDYEETGLMDKTHVHFYTQKTFENLLEENGFEILKMIPTNGMTKVPVLGKFTDRLSPFWQYKINCLIPTLFAYQFVALVKIAN